MSRVPEDNRVPMVDVERFVRTLCHDWRNILNGIDLHLAAAGQAGAPEDLDEETRLARAMVRESVQRTHRVSAALSEPNVAPIAYPAAYFVEDLKARLRKLERYSDARFPWKTGSLDGDLQVDFDAMADAAAEIFENALLFSRTDTFIEVWAATEKNEFVLRLIQPQPDPVADPANWGRLPFNTSKRGHYGVGLYRARRLIAAHGGALNIEFHAGQLTCSIRLPLSTRSSK